MTAETCGPANPTPSATSATVFQPWGAPGEIATVSIVTTGSEGGNTTLATICPTSAPSAGAQLAPAWIYRGDLVTTWFVDDTWTDVDLRWDGQAMAPVRRITDGVVVVLRSPLVPPRSASPKLVP